MADNNYPAFKRFLSTPSVWRATGLRELFKLLSGKISIHALRVEGDLRHGRPDGPQGYFYPRPPCGGRRNCKLIFDCPTIYFYPRPPCGGRRITVTIDETTEKFLSTPSVWRATTTGKFNALMIGISIHALRVEGDYSAAENTCVRAISIHALRVEGDHDPACSA